MLLASETDTLAAGERLAAMMLVGDVITLAGGFGAGKTVFTRGILRGLGFRGTVPSPSYPIVIPYDPPAVRLSVSHVDLYRIETASEIDELALDDVLGHGALVIEWPERLPVGTWPNSLILSLATANHDARCLTANVPPAWEKRWPFP
jgi:tRNA threonylcarbamoyladenosine biosynthesis protein TsaE